MRKNIIKFLWIYSFLLSLSGQDIAAQDSNQWLRKVDSRIRRDWYVLSAAKREGRLSSTLTKGKGSWRKVIVRLSGESAPYPEPGLRLLARKGDVATGLLDLESLPQVAQDPAIRFIRAERRIIPYDDPGVSSIRAERVPPKVSLTGKGVIIGVLDSGIDWNHPDFLSQDGSTRIAAILDLSETADSLSPGEPGAAGPFGGVLFTRENINEALRKSLTLRHYDYMGHGTHVAGTAAASPARPPDTIGIYGGVAGGAEIVAVKVCSTPRDSTFSDVNILNGLSFLDSLSRALGRPYVCNMSFGGTLGPHDGTDSFEKFISAFAAEGLTGRALVVASGNERYKGLHARGNFSGDSLELKLQVNGAGSKNDQLRVEIWLSSGHPGLSFTLVSPAGNRYGPFPDGYGGKDTMFTKDGVLLVENAYGGPDLESGDRLIAVEFYDLLAVKELSESGSVEIAAGTWRFILNSSAGSFDAYLDGTRGLAARFGSYVTELGSLSEPASSPPVISVGAYTARTDWRSAEPGVGSAKTIIGGSVPGTLTYFSGLGPNRKGVLKPEITAPGRWVMASLSRWAWPVGEHLSIFESPAGGMPLLMVAQDSIHAVGQGTSFAAPHVAGLCALLLQANPNLASTEIKNILTATASRDSMTGGAPDNYWGYGRADAIAAVRKVLGFTVDSAALFASLSPDDTLRTDSLKYSISVDFTGSAQLMNSCRIIIRWPSQYLRLLLPLDTLWAQGKISFSFDATEEENGVLVINGYSSQGLPAKTEIFQAVFSPLSAASVDSVAVFFEAQSVRGDREPFELSGLVGISQAKAVALRPVLACRIPGDVDGNGKLDIFDLVEMIKILSGRAFAGPCSDLDRSGRTDIFDLIKLLHYLAGA